VPGRNASRVPLGCNAGGCRLEYVFNESVVHMRVEYDEQGHWTQVRTALVSQLCICRELVRVKTDSLPRQARDKPEGELPKKRPFTQIVGNET
jgi:hypothetical protein